MKRFAAIGVFVFLVLQSATGSAAQFPKVIFEISPSFDSRICGTETLGKIKHWYKEAYSRLPEFQREWNNLAPRYLGETVKVVGKPFSRKEKTAVLMVCPKWIGIGTPLLLPYWPFLKVARKKPVNRSVFFSYMFHEVLHPYVYGIVPFSKETALKKKYAKDPLNKDGMITAHLHLMAIQKIVMERLGLKKELALLREADQFHPAYSRTWKIVDAEGALTILRELKGR
jgi:hypothetical protein